MLGRIGHGGACHAEWCIDCGGYSDRRDTRKQRRLESRVVRREVFEATADAPWVPLVDLSDCRHGCSGYPGPCASPECSFTCHTAADVEFAAVE